MLYNHVINKISKLDYQMIYSVPEGGNWQNIPCDIPSKRLEGIRRTGGRTTLYGRLSWDKPSYTISTYFTRPGNGTYIHPNDNSYECPQHRLITPREAARLQSFPDSYIFKGSKSSIATQIGNAVPPLLAYAVAKEIKKYVSEYNMIDLFSGAGGLGLGFKLAGFNVLVANDLMEYATQTYQFNNPNVPFVKGDITTDEVKIQILDMLKHKTVNVICGGPPCQGFSLAGKQLSDDPRNFLYKEFVSLVSQIKPKVFVMENVPGILSSNKGQTYKSIQLEFSSLGYNVNAKKLLAANYGVPQLRNRVFIVGVRDCTCDFNPQQVIQNKKNFVSTRDAISNLTNISPSNTNDIPVPKPLPTTDYQSFLAGEMSVHQFLSSLE